MCIRGKGKTDARVGTTASRYLVDVAPGGDEDLLAHHGAEHVLQLHVLAAGAVIRQVMAILLAAVHDKLRQEPEGSHNGSEASVTSIGDREQAYCAR